MSEECCTKDLDFVKEKLNELGWPREVVTITEKLNDGRIRYRVQDKDGKTISTGTIYE